MPELVQLIPDEDEETDRRILELRVAGSSVHEIAKKVLLPRYEIERRLDRGLPKVDATFRRRAIALSLLRIDELTETFHKQAKAGDIEAGNLMVRLEAERRALLGLTGSGYDPTQLVAVGRDRESSLAAWQRAIEATIGKPLPNELSDTDSDKQLSEKR